MELFSIDMVGKTKKLEKEPPVLGAFFSGKIGDIRWSCHHIHELTSNAWRIIGCPIFAPLMKSQEHIEVIPTPFAGQLVGKF
jgi:hypothetical protein